MNTCDTLPTRGSLLARMKDLTDQDSWREFDEIYRGFLLRLALKAGLREDEAEEALQEVLVSLTRHIGEFTYDPAKCSFKHWLSQMVRWRIQDQFKKRAKREQALPPEDQLHLENGDLANPDEANTHTHPNHHLATTAELEALWEAEWKQYVLEEAEKRIKVLVKAKQYQIFSLLVLKGQPAKEVMERLNVSAAQVYLAKFRVGRLFRQQVQLLEKTLL